MPLRPMPWKAAPSISTRAAAFERSRLVSLVLEKAADRRDFGGDHKRARKRAVEPEKARLPISTSEVALERSRLVRLALLSSQNTNLCWKRIRTHLKRKNQKMKNVLNVGFFYNIRLETRACILRW